LKKITQDQYFHHMCMQNHATFAEKFLFTMSYRRNIKMHHLK